MTYPGLGGQQAPPLNGAPAGQLVPGVTPGVTGIVVASRVIIIGSGGELLVYSPTAGAGNLIASVAGANGVDSFGNNFLLGLATYSAGQACQMTNSDIDFYTGSQAGGWTINSQILMDSGGNLTITAGAILSLASNIGNVQILGSQNTGNGSNGGVTSGPSGTVSAFPAAGPNHTHAEVHTHPL